MGYETNPFIAVPLANSSAVGVTNAVTYGARGDGSTDDTAAIRQALVACSQAGGGTVYIPNGTYIVTSDAANSVFSCFEIPSNVTLTGESRTGTILKLKTGSLGSIRIVWLGNTDSTVQNMTLDGNKSALSVDEHRSGIFIDSAIRPRISNVTIRNNTGDGISVWTNAQDVDIQNVYSHDNDRDGISLIGGGQRGISISNSQFVNNVGQQVDMEPPSDGTSFSDVVIRGCYMAQGASTDYSMTVTGPNKNDPSKYITISDNYIVGPVFCVWADDVSFIGNHVVNATAHEAVQIYRQCRNWVLTANHFQNTSASTALMVVSVIGVTSGDIPSNIRLIGNVITAGGTINDGIYVGSCVSAYIEHNQIVGNSGLTGAYGVELRSATAGIDIHFLAVRGNYIADFHVGVLAWGNGATVISDADISHNQFESVTPGLVAAALHLDFDAQHVIKQATIIGNSMTSSVPIMTYTWPGSGVAGYPTLVGGSRGTGGVYNGFGAPSFTEAIGALYLRRDGGATTTLYVNTSGSTTWTAK